MIPRSLAAWTLEAIHSLLRSNTIENESFDCKVALPHKHDAGDKATLARDCAAFANSRGGYLVFGVKDDVSLNAEERVVGIANTGEFGAHFGSFPSACEPSVEWEARVPPLTLASGRVVHVVLIHESRRKPHGNRDGDRWWFMKRTAKGNEHMSYDEIRQAFEATEFKRTKLGLLVSEITLIQKMAEAVVQGLQQDRQRVYPVSWQTLYPTALMDAVLGDALSVLGNAPEVLEAVNGIRSAARKSNIFAEQIARTMFDEVNENARWQGDMDQQAGEIVRRAEVAVGAINRVLGARSM